MKDAGLQVLLDPVADVLDDMAALGAHWARNRERGRMPGGIRAAMVLVARELLSHVDAGQKDDARLRCLVDFKTAKQAGVIAGDGKPCPNDHDPSCGWPQCNCRQWGQ